MAQIVLDHVEKVYPGGIKALDDLNLDVKEGEFMVLVGPSARGPRACWRAEPLSNLDAKLRVSMRAALNQLHERLHTTTVYVTHDQVEAMTLGQRVCVLRDGQLQQVDTPQRLFESPVNLF